MTVAIVMAALVLLTPLFFILLYPRYSPTRVASRREIGRENIQLLAKGVLLYAADADEHFPLTMQSALYLQLPIGLYLGTAPASVLRTANPKGGGILGDPRLNGRSRLDLSKPAESVMLYDYLPWPQGDAPVAFTDGHAKFIPFLEIATRMKRDPFKPRP